MGELANCSKCDKLFVKTVTDVCNDCQKEEEKAFQTVYTFVRKRENRTATVSEISEGTGVSEELIHKFVRQGRLRPTQFPNIGYPCEKCGKYITKGKLCESCQNSLAIDLRKAEQEKEIENKNKKYDSSTYFTNKEE